MSNASICYCTSSLFFFNYTATTEIYTLSLHDALPILEGQDDPDMGDGEEGEEGRPGRGRKMRKMDRRNEIGRAHV